MGEELLHGLIAKMFECISPDSGLRDVVYECNASKAYETANQDLYCWCSFPATMTRTTLFVHLLAKVILPVPIS